MNFIWFDVYCTETPQTDFLPRKIFLFFRHFLQTRLALSNVQDALARESLSHAMHQTQGPNERIVQNSFGGHFQRVEKKQYQNQRSLHNDNGTRKYVTDQQCMHRKCYQPVNEVVSYDCVRYETIRFVRRWHTYTTHTSAAKYFRCARCWSVTSALSASHSSLIKIQFLIIIVN